MDLGGGDTTERKVNESCASNWPPLSAPLGQFWMCPAGCRRQQSLVLGAPAHYAVHGAHGAFPLLWASASSAVDMWGEKGGQRSKEV